MTIEQAIAAARADERAKVIEECAKVVEHRGMFILAEEIRALAAAPKVTP